MVNKEKLNFLKTDFITHLKKLSGTEKPQWGVMNPQQMVEHMGMAFLNASGKLNFPLTTPAEQVPTYKKFLMTEKDFKPNTPNALMSETPLPLRFPDMQTAIEKLEKAITGFENYFADNENKNLLNPFFGELNFEEWVQLLHKHALHHLRQFGIQV